MCSFSLAQEHGRAFQTTTSGGQKSFSVLSTVLVKPSKVGADEEQLHTLADVVGCATESRSGMEQAKLGLVLMVIMNSGAAVHCVKQGQFDETVT